MDVRSDGAVLVYRVGRGGFVVGEKVAVGEEPVEVRVLRGRDYYEARAGCKFFWGGFFLARGLEKGWNGLNEWKGAGQRVGCSFGGGFWLIHGRQSHRWTS